MKITIEATNFTELKEALQSLSAFGEEAPKQETAVQEEPKEAPKTEAPAEEAPKAEATPEKPKKAKKLDPWDEETPDVNACKIEMRARLSKLNAECGSERLRDVLLKYDQNARFPNVKLEDYPALAEDIRKVMRYA